MEGRSRPVEGVPSTTYDELPYHDQAFVSAHPDRLAVVGRLFGITAPSVAQCSVLELGCGLGGNLFPMAALLPDSRFVGIDLSARQIEEGLGVVARLDLDNVELRRQDLMDFAGDEGGFDYILCHGVFSWVPPAVQARLLDICGAGLSPNGLAMISYNTFPGWRPNGAIRDLLRYGARGAEGPREQVRQALEFLSLVARNVFEPESPYGRWVGDAAERLTREDPTYVFHEYLEEYNLPVRFEDFARRCSAAGLRFVGDAELHDPSTSLSDESRGVLSAMADDVVGCEQLLDFLGNRTFRRDVLCRGDVATERWPQPGALEGMLLVSQAEPVPPHGGANGGTQRFRSPAGRVLATSDPVLTDALTRLHRARPGAIAYADLVTGVRSTRANVDDAGLARSLLACAGAGLVGLHTHLPPIATRPPARPRASRVARWQAETGKLVVDPRHRSLRLDPFSAGVLALLDGTRTLPALHEAVRRAIRNGRLEMEGRADRGRRAGAADVRRVVDDVVDGLAGLGLVLDDPE